MRVSLQFCKTKGNRIVWKATRVKINPKAEGRKRCGTFAFQPMPRDSSGKVRLTMIVWP